MGTVGTTKICIFCRQNVADKPRTKDEVGNYYCNPCWAAVAARRAASIVDRSAAEGKTSNAFASVAPLQDVSNPSTTVRPALRGATATPNVVKGGMKAYALGSVLGFWGICSLIGALVLIGQGSVGPALISMIWVVVCMWGSFHFVKQIKPSVTFGAFFVRPVIAGVIIFVLAGIFASVSNSHDASDAKQKSEDSEAAANRASSDATIAVHNKAEHMRDLGMTGSDDALAATYDRAKSVDDARKFREHELGN
jgi:hypothetical protein